MLSNSTGKCFPESQLVCRGLVPNLCQTLCIPMNCSTPGSPVLHCLSEFAQSHVHWVSDAIQPSHPLSAPSPPTFNLSSIRVFSNESVIRIRWPKYWCFNFNIIPSNEYSGLISFRMVWLDILAVQGTLKGLLQHHSSKASILQHSAFFAEVFLELIDKNYYVPHFLCSMKCHWPETAFPTI